MIQVANETERYLRASQVCEILNAPKATVYDWVAKRQIESVRIGRSIRVPESALREFIERRTVSAIGDE